MLEMNSTDGLGGGSITQIVKRFNAETFTYFVGFATLSREWKRGILCVGEKENERKRKTCGTLVAATILVLAWIYYRPLAMLDLVGLCLRYFTGIRNPH